MQPHAKGKRHRQCPRYWKTKLTKIRAWKVTLTAKPKQKPWNHHFKLENALILASDCSAVMS